MNREIKFRGQRVGTIEWLYFDLKNFLENNSEPMPNAFQYVLKNLTEYTGLKDKNGIEIYEGDKLIHEGYSLVLVVVFVKGEFKLQRIDYFESGRKIYSEIKGANYRKIIGDVFENTELSTN